MAQTKQTTMRGSNGGKGSNGDKGDNGKCEAKGSAKGKSKDNPTAVSPQETTTPKASTLNQRRPISETHSSKFKSSIVPRMSLHTVSSLPRLS
jgi:hypothetical protein